MIADVIQVSGMMVVVVSLIFVAIQTRQLVSQTRAGSRASSHNAAYNALDQLHQIEFYLVENPDLIPYLADGVAVPEVGPERQQLLVLAGTWADAIEYGLMTADLEKVVQPYEGWTRYAVRSLARSPALRARLSDDAELWPRLARVHAMEAM